MAAYDTPSILNPKELTPYERWKTEIAYAEKELEKFWERGRRASKKYVDERDAIESMDKYINLFFANTNILQSALYSNPPQPEVKRKYTDYNDQIARVAAMILQRVIEPDCDDPRDTFDSTMAHAVLDRLVSGLGAAWLRLETDTEEVESEYSLPAAGDADNTPEPNAGFETSTAPDANQYEQQEHQKFTKITDQRVVVDYVFWEDFLWSPCKIWEERRWVGRRVLMSQEELIKRFGAEKGKAIPLNHNPNGGTTTGFPNDLTPKHLALQLAYVYEIWDRSERKVIWLCKDYPEILDTKDDFLHLIGFEPCPKPMLANITTSNTVPRPDHYMVQDQYNELDNLNNRISLLQRACKVVGVYDRSAEGVQRMLTEGSDNTLIPVDNWAMFAEKGGVKGQIDWLPLEMVVTALQRLVESRELVKQQIYEVTGIADIVRGASKASETLGAQEIKAKFASVRIKALQDEVACFAAEISRIRAEITVKHIDPYVLECKSNVMHTDDAPLAQQAIDLIKSEEGFEWRITVTSDQLAQTDYQLEKQDRIELLSAVSQYLAQASQMFQAIPQSAPMLVSLMKWAVAGFRGAKDIEGMLDRELDAMLKQPPQQKPDPEQQKAELEQKKMQGEMQMAREGHQMDMQAKIMDINLARQKGQQELRQKAQMAQLDAGVAMQKAQADIQVNAQKAQQEVQQANMQTALAAIEGQQKLRQNEAAGAQKLRQGSQAHEQKMAQSKALRRGGKK